MSRGSTLIRSLALILFLASVPLTSCVFDPPPGKEDPIPDVEATTPEELIDNLATAYQTRSYARFQKLISQDPTAPYTFRLNAPRDGEEEWDANVELRIHKRMFEPQNIDPGDTPLDPGLWLHGVTIRLTLQSDFQDRPDLYRTTPEGQGLDPDRWIAREAIYETHLLFELVGTTDYQVDGTASFVVIEDKLKASGDVGKFLIYIWEDLQAPGKPAA